MSSVTSVRIPGHLGTHLAVHRLGAGRPVVLLHGLFSSAQVNWIKYGTAAQLAEAGFEAIMPDLRAHGASEAPHDPAAYPPGVLVRDAMALVAALGLEDYDVAGFSLGSRTAVSAVLAGLKPRRLVLGGMGLEGFVRLGYRKEMEAIADPAEREEFYKAKVAGLYANGKAVSIASVLEIDEVIDPAETRRWIMAGLQSVPKPEARRHRKRPCIDAW